MNHSAEIKDLATALAKAQGEFKHASMDCINPHFKSAYASLASIMDAVKEPLSKHGLSLVHALNKNESGLVLESTLLHSSGQWLVGTMPLLMSKQDMQGLGSAVTYAKRYAAAALLGIVADADDDANAAIGKPGNPLQKKSQSNEAKEKSPQEEKNVLMASLIKAVESFGWSNKEVTEAIFTKFGKPSTKELSVEELKELVSFIENYDVPRFDSTKK